MRKQPLARNHDEITSQYAKRPEPDDRIRRMGDEKLSLLELKKRGQAQGLTKIQRLYTSAKTPLEIWSGFATESGDVYYALSDKPGHSLQEWEGGSALSFVLSLPQYPPAAIKFGYLIPLMFRLGQDVLAQSGIRNLICSTDPEPCVCAWYHQQSHKCVSHCQR